MVRKYWGPRGRKYSIILVLIALLGVGLVAPQQANAYTLTGCKWGSSRITYTDQALGQYSPSLRDAAYSWGTYTDIDGMYPTGGNMTAGSTYSGANGLDGYTTWNCPFGNLFTSRVELNWYYGQSMSYGQLRVVWAHELGHGVGLNHSGVGNVMYSCARCTYNSYGRYNPAPDDIAGMNSIY